MTNAIAAYKPLTSQNTALVLVDHQVGLLTGVRDYSTGELKHNVVALAKAAKALKVPIVVTTTARDSLGGPLFLSFLEALPGVEIIDRSSVNPFDDARVAARSRRPAARSSSSPVFHSNFAPPFRQSQPRVRGWTPTWRSTLQEPSARPSGRLGSSACFRQASFCRTTQH